METAKQITRESPPRNLKTIFKGVLHAGQPAVVHKKENRQDACFHNCPRAQYIIGARTISRHQSAKLRRRR